MDINDLLKIDPKKETEKITKFLKETVNKTGFEKVVVGVSGGVDSAVVLTLCVRALGKENVIAVKMPYGEQEMGDTDLIIKQLGIPDENVFEIDIKPAVDVILGSLVWQDDSRIKYQLDSGPFNESQGKQARTTSNKVDLIRKGNVMARVMMIILFDLAKREKALVCGTENKSEYLLGYYTRFGDEASDIEPIRHLYKTQVYQLAKNLSIPEKILSKQPTAGLWDGQTDERELGFTYQEADEVLYWRVEKRLKWEDISLKVKGEIRDKIRSQVEGNWFKKETPYSL